MIRWIQNKIWVRRVGSTQRGAEGKPLGAWVFTRGSACSGGEAGVAGHRRLEAEDTGGWSRWALELRLDV